MSGTPGDTRALWKRELERTPECIPVDRFGDELTAREHSHLAHCTRCQTELALFREVTSEEESASESRTVRAVAADVAKRLSAPPQNVVTMSRRPREVRFRPAFAMAATILVAVIGIALFYANREPSIEGPASVVKTYRSAAVEVVAPVGDVAAAPASLQWKAVGGAAQYDVEVMEVDRTQLWHGSTTATATALPQSLVEQFVPGKTILWQVRARRGQAIVADSGIQRFRVSTTH